jgi:tetratricopeptide (TPR) repeat protein
MVCRVKKTLILALATLALAGSAGAQRIGLYPLETDDQTLALAVPTAVARALETVDGAILPTPIELLQAVQRRAAFKDKLADVFSLSSIVTGKLEGAAGAWRVTYTVTTAGKAQTVTASGADFPKLVADSDAKLVAALGLKPSADDQAAMKALEGALPAADVVAAAVLPTEASSGAILERGAQNPWALVGRALALLQAGKNADALPLAVAAAKAAPLDQTSQVTLALVQLVNRNNAEAKAAIDAGLKLNPAKPELHYLLGRYLLRVPSPATADSVRTAVASLERALQYNPRFLEAAVIASDQYTRLGDIDSAYTVLAKLVPKMPDELSLHTEIMDLLINTDRDNATTYLSQVLKTYPDVPDTVYALAGRLFDTGVATRLVADGETRYPQSAVLASARGNLLERQTKYEDAVAAYKTAISRDAKLQSAGLSLAGVLSKLGRFDEAEAAIQTAFGRVDQKLLARMYMQTGRLDRAKAVIDKLPNAATDFDVPYLLGVHALRSYQADVARTQLTAAIKLNNNDSRPKLALADVPDLERMGAPKLTGPALYQFQLAKALMDNDSPLEAKAVLEAALKTAPRDLHLNFLYGYVLYFIADPDDAVDQFTATLALAPDNVVVMSYLAQAYIANSRFDLAVDQANKAIAKDPKYARGFLVLGFANIALGNAAPARDALLKAVGVNADFKFLVDPYLNSLPR